MKTIETEVLIDLSLRGIHCILVEKRDLCAGASGGNHGLLHSGARYVSNDLQSAIECRIEGQILKKIAPHCIEETGGLFVSVKGDHPDFGVNFPSLCQAAGIRCDEIGISEARSMEPVLSEFLTKAFYVNDATVSAP